MIYDNATKDNVYVQMTLQHHGEYTAMVDPNWRDNPFNAANGGWLKNPDDFFTDPKAIALTKAKYRYIEARYGYSTHIFAYELFNEVQNIREASSHFDDVIKWHNIMADYIRSIDPYHHLITTSVTSQTEPLGAANIDFYQIHTYPPDIVSTLDNLPIINSPKPVFVGEWGGGNGQAGLDFLHDGLWAGISIPTAGGSQFWAWDEIERNNYYPQFKSVADFLNSDGVANLGGGNKLNAVGTGNGPKGTLGFAPPLGWEADKGLDVTIDNTGAVNGLAGISSFLQGTGHKTCSLARSTSMSRQLSRSSSPWQFGDVSQGGAHPTLAVDGGSPVTLDYHTGTRNHPSNGELSVDVPAGSHIVNLGNTGGDWIIIERVDLSNFAPPVGVMGRRGSDGAEFWAYSRNGDQTAFPADTKITLKGLPNGKYLASFWDCQADKALPSRTVTSANDSMTVPLPSAVSDIACYVSRAN